MRRYIVASVMGVLVLLPACADDVRSPRDVDPSPSSPANALTGEAYAAEIGLIPVGFDPSTMTVDSSKQGITIDGEVAPGCAAAAGRPLAFTVFPTGNLYCFSAPTEIETRVMAERLAGHVPADEEIAEALADFAEDSAKE